MARVLSLPSCVVGLTAIPVAAAQDLMSCPSCPTCQPLARRLKPTKIARQHLLQPLASLSTRRWLLLALSPSHHGLLQELRLTLAAAAILVAAPRGATQHAAASCQQLLVPRVQAPLGSWRSLIVRCRLVLPLYSSRQKSCGLSCSKAELQLARSRLELKTQFSNSFSQAECYSKFSIWDMSLQCLLII